MRPTFIRTLIELAGEDERINLVVGDLGFGVVEPFVEKFPNRYLNPGVAEQNMTGIAAGMAMCGKVVFTYSIANFPTLRCVEQIRNDVCYHKTDVKVVSVGGGLGYGALGISHHATEDIAMMRALPGMAVVAPGDPFEAEQATRAVVAQSGPCYLRLGKSGDPRVHASGARFEFGMAIKIREGHDISLIATGSMLANTARAAEELARKGIEARVLSMHTIKPLDTGAVLAAARETAAVVTLEEHSILGGLGSGVAEVLAESNDDKVPFKRLGLPAEFTSLVGGQDYLKAQYGLSVEGVVRSVERFLQTSGNR